MNTINMKVLYSYYQNLKFYSLYMYLGQTQVESHILVGN